VESVAGRLGAQSYDSTARSRTSDVVQTLVDLHTGLRRPSALQRFERQPLSWGLRQLAPCLFPKARVLDLGCGAGALIDALSLLDIDAVGVDVDQASLRQARSARTTARAPAKGRGVRILADNQRLPFASESFDGVISFSVLQYTDWRATIKECRRVLKKGGIAVFIENLHGHPLARLYRLARRLVWPYPSHLVPRRHIRWNELGEFERVFGDMQARAYALLTPALALPFAFRERPAPIISRVVRVPFDLLERFDDRVLENLTSSRHLAWLVGVVCTNAQGGGDPCD